MSKLLKVLNDNTSMIKLRNFQPKKTYPILEKLEISLNFEMVFEGMSGNILPNNLPAELKTFIPLSIFGYVDYFSAFYASDNFILTNKQPYNLVSQGIYGFNNSNVFFGNLLKVSNGDYYKELSAYDSNSDFYSNFSILTTTNQIGYGSILNSLTDSIYIIKSLKIRVPDINTDMFDFPIYFSKLRLDGKIETDSINLRTYVKPNDYNTSIVDIPLNIMLDKNLIINHPIKYDCQKVEYIFQLYKVK